MSANPSNAQSTASPHVATLALIPGIPVVEGIAIIGEINCEALSLKARLLLDSRTLKVTLVLPCGCGAAVSMVPAVQDLVRLAREHAQQPSDVATSAPQGPTSAHVH